MRILVVNDDGIDSRGLVMLAEAARALGEVTVVAPDGQRSAQSQRITVHGDVVIQKAADFPLQDVTAYKISGTPADCVRAGVWYAMEEAPDLVLSGINAGFNAGLDVIYSGTVGAAREALVQGIPSIAVSVGAFDYLDDVRDYLVPMLQDLASRPIERGAFWNVNFPKRHKDGIRGILEERTLCPEPWFQTHFADEGEQEDGTHLRIWMTYPEKLEEGCDVQALIDGYISIGKLTGMLPGT